MSNMQGLQVLCLLVGIQMVAPAPPMFQCKYEQRPGECRADAEINMDNEQIEETDAGTYLYTLEAWDADNDTVTFEILPYYTDDLPEFEANGIHYLQVNETSGVVTSKAVIDYEKVHTLRFGWNLTDSGGEGFVQKSIAVTVKNINDNDPVFTSKRYQVDPITENSLKPNEGIATVIANDTDSEEGILYGIVQAYSDWPCNGDIFKIDPTTGVISLNESESLDFEKVSLYTICVNATDSGKPTGSGPANFGYAEVILAILDAQDTAPVFKSSNYDGEISEDTPVGSVIATVAATDGDRGVLVANKISYSLVGGDGKFGMNNNSGKISILEGLDRETKDSYTVTVTAQELNENDTNEAFPSSTTVNITFQVGDADDENATFSNHSREKTLFENSLTGTFVEIVGLTAKDKDLSPNNVFYFALGGRDRDAFDIRSRKITGEGGVDLRVWNNTDKLDYEKYKFLQFEIYAQDISGDIVYDTVYVNITLLDQNDETPTFSQDAYVFSIPENSKDEFVNITEATDKDSDEFNQITYELLGQGSDPQFVINKTTGEIYSKVDAALDYEIQKVYFLTCVASDSQRRGTATVQIELMDENDNPPEFNPTEYTVNVEENQIPDEFLVQVTARDIDDAIENKEIFFSLLNTFLSEKFRIDKITATTAIISLDDILDFEEDGPLFNLTVIAANRGNVSKMTTANVNINIQDMNDHSPVFVEDVFVGEIPEDAKRGDFVLQVKAEDMDRVGSANARIDYFFRETDVSVSAFRIEISTGRITVNDQLDRDLEASYELEVEALDRGDPYQPPGNCSVIITILDVNNKKPTFSEETPVEEINEGVVNGTLITMVTASDSDETAELVYSFDTISGFNKDDKIEQNFSGWFSINQTGGVFTVIELDREKVTRFVIPVVVKDVNATEEQMAIATLSLTILDVNDNPPAFSDVDYEFDVTENDIEGTIISAIISATDKDEGSNGEIIFDLVDDKNLMKIDPETGILQVNGMFNREEMATYHALIVATDKGDPVQNTTKNITISIIDVNEFPPKFKLSNYSVALLENFTAGMEILRVSATDQDAGDIFGHVTFGIASGNADDIFTINGTTGVIMIKEGAKLDRETEEEHILTINAIDGGGRSENEAVEIIVLDVNDNAPVFNKFEPRSIQETVPEGDIVFTVTATDADQPGTPSSQLEYSIEGGSDKAEELFNITTSDNTGNIMVKSSLANRVGIYSLLVVVRDGGSPSNNANATVQITVTDVNDDPPEITFPTDLSTIYVEENSTGFVLNLTALDSDVGINGEIYFKFVQSSDGQEFFELDSKSNDDGVCMVSFKDGHVTDRETKAEYELTIEAYNKGDGNNKFATRVTFIIKVNDTDDNEPIFWEDESDQSIEFSVFENNATAVIGLVSEATDADEPSNQLIFYFIVNGNTEDCFTLNKESRQLSLKKSLDREKNDTYENIVIKVTSDFNYDDSIIVPYDPTDNTLLQVTVKVLDVNDNGPIFTSKSYTGGVEYNTGFDSEVIVVKAIDADFESNAIVNYFKTSEKKTDPDGTDYPEIIPTFKVDNLTGSIRTLRNFESRDTGYFTLEIVAYDSLNSQYRDTATVSIYLFNEDQQVIFTFALSTDNVRKIEEDFKATLVEVIEKYGDFGSSAKRAAKTVEPVIVVDDLQVFTVDNQPVPGRSVMKLHGVNKEDNTIIDPVIIVNSIDVAYDYVDEFYEKYKVFEVLLQA
ncbi:cadherin-23-like isoform X2 [Asterias rubens]|uniref:cadherin-23-like isoform X2 n=1 Tax=Asterias rubens TaxID=7604 RepID=UPI00145554AE|nr:cadherin-23-like isoform X2 [Asterias rubens]